MNRWILTAAVLSAATVLVHVFIGGPEVHVPYLQSGLPELLKTYSSVLWHVVTLVLAANSLALFTAARQTSVQIPLVLLVTGQYLGCAGLLVFYGIARLGSLAPMPQWTIFIAVSAMAMVGLLRPMKQGRPA